MPAHDPDTPPKAPPEALMAGCAPGEGDPIAAYFRRVRRATIEANEETCAFSERPLILGSSALVDQSLRQTTNLAAAMRECARIYNLLHGGYYNRVEESTGRIIYHIDEENFPFTSAAGQPDRIEFMEAVQIYLHRLLSAWAGEDLSSHLVAVHSRRRNEDAPQTDLLAYWHCPVRRGSRDFALEYHAAAGKLPSAQALPPLDALSIYDVIIAERSALANGAVSASADLLARLRELVLMGESNQTRIAAMLGTSVATLRRRLASRDTSFRALRAETLNERARAMLSAGKSQAMIAEALGFSDSRSFARAFKQWNGISPARYRRGA